jgi:DNA polymerase-4
MPLRTAFKRCPECIFLAVDAAEYERASAVVMDTLRSFDVVVEVAGWDEAYLAADTDDPESLARQIQTAVLDRTRLWSSIGIGDNKLRAKLATGFAKPRGTFVLTRENWADVMAGQPVEALWGIGRKTAAKLEALGIRIVEQLERTDGERLARAFGPNTGPWLRRLATGEDATPVRQEPYLSKGHGKERTFQHDLTDIAEIRRETAALACGLAGALSDEQRPILRVIVKVRFAPFFTASHGVAFDGSLERSALAALDRFELTRPVRLLGVRAEFR